MNDRAYTLLREALSELRPVEVLPVEAMLKFADLAKLLCESSSVETVTGPQHVQQVIVSADFKRGIPCS